MSDDGWFGDEYDDNWTETFDMFPDDLTESQIETATDMIYEMLDEGYDWDDIWEAMEDFWDWYEEFYG